jgi:fibronectin-binding autotransporter adhesin
MPSLMARTCAGYLVALALVTTAGRTAAQTTYTFTDTAAEIHDWYNNAAGTPNPTPGSNGIWPNGTGVAPNAPQNTEPFTTTNPANVLVFPGTVGDYVANNNLNPTLGNFQLNLLNLTATVGSPTISGNPLQFVTSGTTAPQITKPGGSTYTITNNMVLTNDLSISGAGGGSLNLGDSTGQVAMTISGPGSLTINRAGNTPFYSTNTYSGGTVWLGGSGNPSLAIGNPAAFGTGTFVIAGANPHITRLVQTLLNGQPAGGTGIVNNGANGNNVTIPNAVSMRADLTISVGNLANSSITWSGPVSLFNGTRTVTQNETGAGKFVAFSGNIQDSIPGLPIPAGQPAEPAVGTGSLTKAGSGPLVLSGANTYHGATSIAAGTLQLTGTGSIANSATIGVNSGATFNVAGVTGGANFNNGAFALAIGQTLAGNGAVTGNVNVRNGSTVAPTGVSGPIGTLSVAGNTALDGILLADVINATSDRLAVTGSLTLTGNSVLTLPPTNVYDNTTPLQLATYAAGESGTFSAINNKPANYDVFYGTFSGFPNAIVLAPVAVPEPGTLALVGVAAVGFGVRRWKARRG